jgi:hypothetical protein
MCPRREEAKDAKAQQDRGGAHVQGSRVDDRRGAQHDAGQEHDRELVADGDRQQRAQHGAPAALLHPPRDGEQPAHRRVETVVGPEPGEGEAERLIAHGKQ